MAFVTEQISNADRHKINEERLSKLAPIQRISHCVNWTIDRDRNAYLVQLGGGLGEIPESFALVWNDDIISIATKSKFEYGKQGTRETVSVTWNISAIFLPKLLESRRIEIQQLIREALDAYGFLADRKGLESVTVNFASDCRYILLENDDKSF